MSLFFKGSLLCFIGAVVLVITNCKTIKIESEFQSNESNELTELDDGYARNHSAQTGSFSEDYIEIGHKMS